ncbi:MAG: hypothetical protein KDK24_12910 [Pseudooceanicola sp.]|nr:hypothetical protein [Pseudooceanicola sp.]
MTGLLIGIIAICAVICAVFFARILFFGPMAAVIVGGIATGALMYWAILGIVAGFDTRLSEGMSLTQEYWLKSCLVWIPVYLGTLWLLMRGQPRDGK